MRTILVFLVTLMISACATAQTAPADTQPTLQQIAADDLDAAISQATADGDSVSLQCWNSLKANLGTINKPIPEIKGVFSAIQAKRSVKARIDAGVLPPEVVAACSTLYVQEHFGIMKDMLSFLGLVRK